MCQRQMREELKHDVESHQFHGFETEQFTLVYSIIKLSKKIIQTLYKKCQNVTTYKQFYNETKLK
jgi:hypothetical protein